MTTAAAPARSAVDRGLASTTAAESQMSFIDGEKGVLEYVGIDIDLLARHSTFEETVFLLWNLRLPRRDELAGLTRELRAEANLPGPMWDLLRTFPRDATPMHALRTLVSALALFDREADDDSPAAAHRKAVRLQAKVPTIIANFDRHRRGEKVLEPRGDQDVAASFLTMLNGKEPTPAMSKIMDVCLILHAEHGFNASTFAAMVTISTLSDLYSAITTAIGTLKGPLHGGANEEVMHMLLEIGSLDRVDAYIQEKLARKDRIMGFGHRVYKAVDPRATYLRTLCQQVAEDTGNQKLFQMSKRIEEIMRDAVAAKGIYPNVDFYSATTYYSLGLKLDLFTPIFAMARVAGWVGHCIEYLKDNKLMRPRCEYVGPHGAAYVPMAQR